MDNSFLSGSEIGRVRRNARLAAAGLQIVTLVELGFSESDLGSSPMARNIFGHLWTRSTKRSMEARGVQ